MLSTDSCGAAFAYELRPVLSANCFGFVCLAQANTGSTWTCVLLEACSFCAFWQMNSLISASPPQQHALPLKGGSALGS